MKSKNTIITILIVIASAFMQPVQAAFPGSNGKIIFESFRAPYGGVHIMNQDGTKLEWIPHSSAIIDDYEPSISADGTKIAFISPINAFDIWTENVDGTNPKSLTSGSGDQVNPAWSPDGKHICYASNNARGATTDIWIMNNDGSGKKQLTNTPNANEINPSYSPSGTKIIFDSNRDGDYEIYVMNIDGSNQVRLTNNATDDLQADWSPDGNKIVFTSHRNGNNEIYVMNADGSNPVRLTNNTANDEGAVWSPDGNKIAFASERNGNLDVYTMNVDGLQVVQLTNNPAPDFQVSWQATLNLSYNLTSQPFLDLDFSTNYDAKNTQIVQLKNTSATPISVSNVVISDAGNYWVNLFMDNKRACRAKHYTPSRKNFTIPANSSCTIGIGFSPFDDLNAGKSIPATLTLKTLMNGIATDKVINVTGLGRAQVANFYNNNPKLWGQDTWGVSELKGGNAPINTSLVGASTGYGSAKFWYGGVINPIRQKALPSVGNLVVFAQNSASATGHVGMVIQTKPVVTMLSMNDIKDSNGAKVRKWSVRPVDGYPNATATWQPLITGFNSTDATKHYGFISWKNT